MKNFTVVSVALLLAFLFSSVPSAKALELDWTGQFRSEVNFIHNYTMDSGDAAGTNDTTRSGAGGYYVSPAGQSSANFQTLFLRLKPRLVVNDNVYIKSEWWVGDPVYGFFGGGTPYSPDLRRLNSTFTRGASITAQRFWGEILTDVGTFHMGRAPLNYGLGLVWSSGDGLWDRYASTGDVIRLVSKFGAFSFSPSFVSYSTGNTIGGACVRNGTTGNCDRGSGSGGINDYSIMLKYDNPEEDFEAGVNFIRRLAGADQDPTYGFQGPDSGTAPGMNYNIWDIYGKRKIGSFTFGAEAPISTGTIGGAEYSAFALAAEVDWKINDSWQISAKGGQAPGQSNTPTASPGKWELFSFHPNYKLGMIMFNYQLANFGGVTTQNDPRFAPDQLSSPYDNPITNARYFGVSGKYRTDKWTFHGDWVFAKALKTATATDFFMNSQSRTMVQKNAAAPDQQESLGWELDGGAAIQWDDNFRFGLDLGLYFPGAFYKFSNATTGVENKTDMVFATVLSAGVNF